MHRPLNVNFEVRIVVLNFTFNLIGFMLFNNISHGDTCSLMMTASQNM
jgi:hypothetical protein